MPRSSAAGSCDTTVVVVVDGLEHLVTVDLFEEERIVDRLALVAGQEGRDGEDGQHGAEENPHGVARPARALRARTAAGAVAIARRWRWGRRRVGRHEFRVDL